ncbi:MAG: hypothetical protein SGJ27_20665 [Candidatus Melainabacteria bacterium]|nr:hypothetical protein [Candidatus Melainabacteria bacterium]
MTNLEQFQNSNVADNSITRSGLSEEYNSMSRSDLLNYQSNSGDGRTDTISSAFGDLQITSDSNQSKSLNFSPESNLPQGRSSLLPAYETLSNSRSRSLQELAGQATDAISSRVGDVPKVTVEEVPVIDFNKTEVTPETIKAAKDNFEKEMKKDAPEKGTEEMVKTIADGILSGDPAIIQKMLKAVKTPEDLEKLQKAAEYVGKKLGIHASAGKTFDGKPYLQMRAFFQHQNLTGGWENEVQMSIYPDSVSTHMKSTLPVAGEDRPRLKKVDPTIVTPYLQKGLINKGK